MKAMILVASPEECCNLLNGDLSVLTRKKFPKDYVGWVYIYCTKNGHLTKCSNGIWYNSKHGKPYDSRFSYYSGYEGKVVARFWVDKVEEHKDFGMFPYRDLRFNKATCLSGEDLEDYGFVDGKGYVPLYAIHITKLKIFDKPKEIKEFKQYKLLSEIDCMPKLTRAPRNGYCYVEI